MDSKEKKDGSATGAGQVDRMAYTGKKRIEDCLILHDALAHSSYESGVLLDGGHFEDVESGGGFFYNIRRGFQKIGAKISGLFSGAGGFKKKLVTVAVVGGGIACAVIAIKTFSKKK